MLDVELAKASAVTGLTLERTLREVARIAYGDARKFYRTDGTLKSAVEWDEDMAAVVAAVEVDEQYTGAGEKRRLTGQSRKSARACRSTAVLFGICAIGVQT
jgi:hypothetical protein